MYDLREKSVFVTGAGGFIGSNLARKLLARGAQVHITLRQQTSRWRLEELSPRLHVHIVDLRERGALRAVFDVVRPEVIFHAAIYGAYPGQQDRAEMIASNILAANNLVSVLEESTFYRFVHMGSSTEYGKKNTPMKESETLEPTSFYGLTNAAATLLFQQAAREMGLPIVTLRVFSVYGYWEGPTRLIPTAILAGLRGGDMALTSKGFRHDFIFVEDVVDASLRALDVEDIGGKIINIGTGCQWSNEEIVAIINRLTGGKMNIRYGAFPTRLTDTTFWVADTDKAMRMLDWSAGHTIEQGLAKTVAWFREHAPLYERLG